GVVEALLVFFAARMQYIDVLRAKLSSLARSGEVFEADAVVSDDHLFKMQVEAGLLAKAGLADKLPKQAGMKRLAEADARAKALASEGRAATEKAKADLPDLEKALAEARTAGGAVAQQRAAPQQTQGATP